MSKKIPVRQCVACRQQKEKPQLARITRTPQGDIVYDPKGKAPGRGAYLCKSVSCLEKAIKSRALARALDCQIPDEVYDTLRQQLMEEGPRMENNLLAFIGLMKKADSLAIGGENAYDAARTHKARLMVLAQNAGDNTMGQAQAVAKQYQVPHITLPCSKEELGGALGMRECAAFAVTDTGFALSLCRKCQMEETAQALSERLAREKKRKQKKIDRAQGKGAGSHRRKGGI